MATKKPAKKAPPPKKGVKKPRKLTPEQYHSQVLEAADKMTAKITATIEQETIEAELRKTKPRSPRRFASDLFWENVGKEDEVTLRKKRPGARPIGADGPEGATYFETPDLFEEDEDDF